MRRFLCILLLLATAVPAQAHFIWIVPEGGDPMKARVVFSEGLEPDDSVAIEKIAATKLFMRDGGGKVSALDWKKSEHAYQVNVPAKAPAVIGGVCKYGVLQRGEGKPFLLAYYPKLIQGTPQSAKAWDKLALEIVSQGAGRFQVIFAGKPAADAEIVVLTPVADGKETHKADAQGAFKIHSTAPGLYGIRARHIEAREGEYDGKKYDEARHYATLVFRMAAVQSEKPEAKKSQALTAGKLTTDYAPLPRAVSSFGAAVADGWLYVYGGHCAKTHVYSTEAVLGTFHRLKLTDPQTWETLPSGPSIQGLALVEHAGKIYRIGGMQPRNQPGEKTDNHSLASCARFDPAAKKWEVLPELPEVRSSHDAAVVGDNLIVVGGWKMYGAGKKTDWHTTTLVLNLKQQPLQWQSVKQPFQRRALTAASYNGKVYVIGGMTEDAGAALTVNIYDPAKDVWATGPDIPGPQRNGFSAASCVAGGRLYVSPADGRLFRLGTKGDTWEEAGHLKQSRIVHRMVAVNAGLLLAIGGATKGDNVALTEAIAP